MLRFEVDSEEWRQAVLAEASTSRVLGVALKSQVRHVARLVVVVAGGTVYVDLLGKLHELLLLNILRQ